MAPNLQTIWAMKLWNVASLMVLYLAILCCLPNTVEAALFQKLRFDFKVTWQDQSQPGVQLEKSRIYPVKYMEKKRRRSNRGEWKIDLRSKNSGIILHSHFFNIAAHVNIKSVQKFSVFVPVPQEKFFLVLYKKNGLNHLDKVLEENFLNFKLEQSRSLGAPKELLFEGDQKKHPILFVSDGYTADESDLFKGDAERFKEAFLTHPLIQPHQNLFSIHRLDSFSVLSGIPSFFDINATQFGISKLGQYGIFDMNRQPKLFDLVGANDYYVFIIVNSDYESGVAYYNNFAIVNRKAPASMIVHEFLHLAVGLFDEYDNVSLSAPSCIMNEHQRFSQFCSSCQSVFDTFLDEE